MREIWRKAKSAADEARILLDAGRPDGAVSRAYYAMFDAARVALALDSAELAEAKTHATILRRFSRHLIVAGKIDVAHGRALRRAFEMRLLADYDAPSIPLGVARTIVDDAVRFLDAVCVLVGDIDE